MAIRFLLQQNEVRIATPVCALVRNDIYRRFIMKVTVKKKDNAQALAIHTEFIKLQDALKYANLVYSGGEAKQLILDEQVLVNDEVCTMRGKKLRDGDKFEFAGQKFVIIHEAE